MRTTLIAMSESAHGAEGVSPWIVGIVVFVLLLALLFGVVAVGGGRDHT